MTFILLVGPFVGLMGLLPTCLAVPKGAVNSGLTTDAASGLEVSPGQPHKDLATLEAPLALKDDGSRVQHSGPSVTLRVVDHHGEVVEVPVDFADARIEPRGFWGDVGVNGMALFFASVLIILGKEVLTWAVAKRQKANRAQRRAMVAQRRAAISAQLEAAELELSRIQDMGKKDLQGDDVGGGLKQLMNRLDSYRDELNEYDAPALLAYVDSLIMQAAQLLRRNRMQTAEREALKGPDYERQGNVEDAGDPGRSTTSAEGPEAALVSHSLSLLPGGQQISPLDPGASDARADQPYARQPSHAGDIAEGERESPVKADQKKASGVKERLEPLEKENLAIHQKPDFDILHRIMKENPGMPPAAVIKLATELSEKRRERRQQLRSRP